MLTVGALFVGIVLGMWPGLKLGVWYMDQRNAAIYDRFRAAALVYAGHGREVADLLEMLHLRSNAEAMRAAVDNLERALPERPR